MTTVFSNRCISSLAVAARKGNLSTCAGIVRHDHLSVTARCMHQPKINRGAIKALPGLQDGAEDSARVRPQKGNGVLTPVS